MASRNTYVSPKRHICQVAITAHSGSQLRDWYVDVFGLVKSGKNLFTPPQTTRVQGVPGAIEKMNWAIDQQDYFQLEFFQFLNPKAKLKSADWRPCDHGYNMMGIVVKDFDLTLHRYVAHSRNEMPYACGKKGERRVCVADPEGNLIEIREKDPLSTVSIEAADVIRPELQSVVRFMRVSVPSLDDAKHTFVRAMGLTLADDIQLHTEQDEKMWGLEGAKSESVLVTANNFLVELVEYYSPEPAPRPKDYLLSDQGFMNIALGYHNNKEFDEAFEHAIQNGMRPNGKPLEVGMFRVMYVNDEHNYSIEMLNARKSLWSISGFNAAEPYVECETTINASAGKIWGVISDHSRLNEWSIFKGTLLREGKESVNGPGCIRELSTVGSRITEEIVEWEEGQRFAYRLRTGAPFRRHQGDVMLFPIDNDRTKVRWTIRFESWIPFTGKVTAWMLEKIFNHALTMLKTKLEDQSTS